MKFTLPHRGEINSTPISRHVRMVGIHLKAFYINFSAENLNNNNENVTIYLCMYIIYILYITI